MLQTIFPKDTSLQRYVDFFYFFRSEADEKWSHIAFPHINTGLSFFNKVSIERGDHRIFIKENMDSQCCVEILGKYTKPVFVQCEGVVDEVAVVFKPLGVNRFINEDFVQVAPHYSQALGEAKWLSLANTLFDAEDRIKLVEEFLLSALLENSEFIKMEQAILMLADSYFDYGVADVAEELGINLKTFQRNFTKMMACSPSDYKRIARFRNSLRSKFQSDEIKSLTSITYENNYTDQSYFIREFRKLTNQNPKLFFKEARQVGGDKIIWEIL